MPSSEPKLPPLDLRDEVKEFEAYEEKREIAFKVCNHRDSSISNGELRCTCGAHWKADYSTLQRLLKALQTQ